MGVSAAPPVPRHLSYLPLNGTFFCDPWKPGLLFVVVVVLVLLLLPLQLHGIKMDKRKTDKKLHSPGARGVYYELYSSLQRWLRHSKLAVVVLLVLPPPGIQAVLRMLEVRLSQADM